MAYGIFSLNSAKILVALYAFLNLWYFVVYTNLIEKKDHVDDSPVLRARLGTILWHSGDRTTNGSYHLYCFYPSSKANYDNKSGEYIIKRANKLDECNNWYGKAMIYEGSWVSEKEKLWWSKEQKLEEELAAVEKSYNQL